MVYRKQKKTKTKTLLCSFFLCCDTLCPLIENARFLTRYCCCWCNVKHSDRESGMCTFHYLLLLAMLVTEQTVDCMFFFLMLFFRVYTSIYDDKDWSFTIPITRIWLTQLTNFGQITDGLKTWINESRQENQKRNFLFSYSFFVEKQLIIDETMKNMKSNENENENETIENRMNHFDAIVTHYLRNEPLGTTYYYYNYYYYYYYYYNWLLLLLLL